VPDFEVPDEKKKCLFVPRLCLLAGTPWIVHSRYGCYPVAHVQFESVAGAHWVPIQLNFSSSVHRITQFNS